MGALVWLHGDSLSPHDPALQANPAAPAVFVFDEDLLAASQLSFKRLQFLYECALEAIGARPGAIHRGQVVAELLAACAEHGAATIHVTTSAAPRFQRYVAELRRHLPVQEYPPPQLVGWRGEPPRRFSAFWRKVEAEAMRPTGTGPAELSGDPQRETPHT